MFLKENRLRSGIAFRDTNTPLRARKVISPSSGIVRVKFPSRKNKRMMYAEGLLEADAFYWLEAATDVLSYREQPFTIRFPDGAQLRRYTPDIEVTLHGGEKIIVEIKPRSSLKRDEVSTKIATLRGYFFSVEADYQVWTDAVIRREPWRSNLRSIYAKVKAHSPSGAQMSAGMALLEPHLPVTLSQAEVLLKRVGLEPYSLIFDGRICLDYSLPLSQESVITKTCMISDYRLRAPHISGDIELPGENSDG